MSVVQTLYIFISMNFQLILSCIYPLRVPNYLQKCSKKNVKKFVLHSKHKNIKKLKVKEGEATARVRSVVICDIVNIIVFMCETSILL